MDMNPQDKADFSGLSCWVLTESNLSATSSALLEGLNIKAEEVTIPKGFKAMVKALFLGPNHVLPSKNYPDVLFLEQTTGHSLLRYIKQQSPQTFTLSMAGEKAYVDLPIPASPAHFEMVLGLVRGNLLRHLTARN